MELHNFHSLFQVLQLAKANKVIAMRLEISEKTVKNHLSTVFQKLDVSDRTQAALWAQRHEDELRRPE